MREVRGVGVRRGPAPASPRPPQARPWGCRQRALTHFAALAFLFVRAVVSSPRISDSGFYLFSADNRANPRSRGCVGESPGRQDPHKPSCPGLVVTLFRFSAKEREKKQTKLGVCLGSCFTDYIC